MSRGRKGRADAGWHLVCEPYCGAPPGRLPRGQPAPPAGEDPELAESMMVACGCQGVGEVSIPCRERTGEASILAPRRQGESPRRLRRLRAAGLEWVVRPAQFFAVGSTGAL